MTKADLFPIVVKAAWARDEKLLAEQALPELRERPLHKGAVMSAKERARADMAVGDLLE